MNAKFSVRWSIAILSQHVADPRKYENRISVKLPFQVLNFRLFSFLGSTATTNIRFLIIGSN